MSLRRVYQAALVALCLLVPTSYERADAPGEAAIGSAPEHLTADAPKETVEGVTFIAPDADSAVALAWASCIQDHAWPLKVVTPSPDEKRTVVEPALTGTAHMS